MPPHHHYRPIFPSSPLEATKAVNSWSTCNLKYSSYKSASVSSLSNSRSGHDTHLSISSLCQYFKALHGSQGTLLRVRSDDTHIWTAAAKSNIFFSSINQLEPALVVSSHNHHVEWVCAHVHSCQHLLPCNLIKLYINTHTKYGEKNDSVVATSVNYGLASSSSSSKSMAIPNRASRKLEAPPPPKRLLPPFKGEHLEWAQINQPAPNSPHGQAPKFPHSWLKISSSPRYPNMIRWTIGGRVHQKWSA